MVKERKKEDNPFRNNLLKRKEGPQMHDSKALQAVPFDAQAAQPQMQELLLAVMEPTLPVEAVRVKPKRGQGCMKKW